MLRVVAGAWVVLLLSTGTLLAVVVGVQAALRALRSRRPERPAVYPSVPPPRTALDGVRREQHQSA